MTRIVVIFAAFVALAGTARAQAAPAGDFELAPPSATAPDVDRRTVTKRYGGEILMADVGAWGLGLATQTGEVTLAGYLIGGPLVHVAHGKPRRAVGSLALRFALPVAGVYAGAAVADCGGARDAFCGLGEIAIGGAIGMATAIAIDAGVLAKDTKTVDAPRRGLVQVGDVAVTPTVAPRLNGGWTMGLTGTF